MNSTNNGIKTFSFIDELRRSIGWATVDGTSLMFQNFLLRSLLRVFCKTMFPVFFGLSMATKRLMMSKHDKFIFSFRFRLRRTSSFFCYGQFDDDTPIQFGRHRTKHVKNELSSV